MNNHIFNKFKLFLWTSRLDNWASEHILEDLLTETKYLGQIHRVCVLLILKLGTKLTTWTCFTIDGSAPSNWIASEMHLIQSSSTRNNFNQFSGDDCLSGAVKCQCKFFNHFSCILCCIVHGRHTRRLFGASTFLHCIEQQWSQWKFQIIANDISVQWIVRDKLIGWLENKIKTKVS